MSQTVEIPRLVNWITVKDGWTFWSTVTQKDHSVGLIGSAFCDPCKEVHDWWEERFAPPGWQFVYWDINLADDDFSATVKEYFKTRFNQSYPLIPYLTIVERKRTGTGEVDIMTTDFQGERGCTQEAIELLQMQSQAKFNF